MLSVQWHMLEAIAGIPVLDQFEVNLFPLKVQLEREIGKKLFEYIFPGVGSGNSDSGNFSPFLAKKSPAQDDDDDSDDQNSMSDTASHFPDMPVSSEEPPISDRANSLELRLRPTKAFGDTRGAAGFNRSGKPTNGILRKEGGHHHLGLFQHSNHSQQSAKHVLQGKTPSKESLRPSHDASSTSLAAMNASTEKHRRFGGIKRSNTGDSSVEKAKASDDLTQMISRASNYMTLAYVKIPSVVLCLSYKGRGERNIEDVHNFVFRMPVLEYRNKTWSNLDLALRLKKDVIRALISHTGAIIGNKFHHRPNKQQQTRLREIANSSSLLANTLSLTNVASSEASSSRDRSRSPRPSDLSRRSQLTRSESWSSSVRSSAMASIRGNSSIYDPSHSPSIPEAEANDKPETPPVSMRQAFTRRFTGDFRSNKDSTAAAAVNGNASGTGNNGEEAEESTRKKSVMLFGKKILGSLNDRPF
ncbi:MAG: hypothetical protein L6R41_007460 [Letrouitia leprolyta]|nr:MAG: hypothetical protein L6R41_007460 [Letrouitia leprolyta]